MKKTLLSAVLILLSTALFAQGKLQGAWQSKTEQGVIAMTIVDNYMAAASFNLEKKGFYATHGARLTSVSSTMIKWGMNQLL
jgi:hypothetical protein